MQPFLALITPLSGHPDQGLPGGGNYPDQGLPGQPPRPAHPIAPGGGGGSLSIRSIIQGTLIMVCRLTPTRGFLAAVKAAARAIRSIIQGTPTTGFLPTPTRVCRVNPAASRATRFIFLACRTRGSPKASQFQTTSCRRSQCRPSIRTTW